MNALRQNASRLTDFFYQGLRIWKFRAFLMQKILAHFRMPLGANRFSFFTVQDYSMIVGFGVDNLCSRPYVILSWPMLITQSNYVKGTFK